MKKQSKKLSRREALARLGLGVSLAYTAPALLALNEAAADSSPSKDKGEKKEKKEKKGSKPSKPSEPSKPSAPSKD